MAVFPAWSDIMSIEWQYTIVGILLGICLVLLLRGVIRVAGRKGAGGCAGCSLSDTCVKKSRKFSRSK